MKKLKAPYRKKRAAFLKGLPKRGKPMRQRNYVYRAFRLRLEKGKILTAS